MNLPMKWLSDFIDVGHIDIKKYCDRMTSTGSKVEGWSELGDDIENVVAGRIISIEKHPDSDHMFICLAEVGEDAPRQIVTGAQNVYEGAVVPVAKAPSKLPGGVIISAGKLRGVVSNGMLCSISELGLTTHDLPWAADDGILILNHDRDINCENIIGADICDVLSLRDSVVEFEITPNRPDCLSVIGLARETGASYYSPVKYHNPQVKGSGGDIKEYLNVDVLNAELCPRYTARVVRNIKIEPSPLWMRMRLHAAGVRPINNIVDITNYVMLEYGQPMHAFDYSCIDGKKITVREAVQDESFQSLDNINHTLSAGMLVIADDKKAIALAGVMGGANSEIKNTTDTVVFESANFKGSSVRITSRLLGMRTESSGRFEKGLDAEMTDAAVERACELVELIGAGEVVDGVVDVYKNKRKTIMLPLEADRINSLIGVEIDGEHMKDILRSLDFELDGDIIKVPSFRADVECRADIAEEIIRISGYDTIEATRFRGSVKTGQFAPRQAYKQRLNNLLCSLGLNECYMFSFISTKYYDKIRLAEDDPRRNSLSIRNPLGEDTAVMRTVLLPSVLESLARNNNFGAENASLYETAAIYLPSGGSDLPAEPIETAIAFYGGDFYRMKGIIEAVLEDAHITGTFAACRDNPTYHPGRCASVTAPDGKLLCVFGELHPKTAENYGFDKTVYAATLHTETVFACADFTKKYSPLPKYPAITRDLAFVCDETREAGEFIKVITEAGGKLTEDIKLFDVYRGSQLSDGKKSMAFNITLRAPDRTLTDAEAEDVKSKIINAAVEKLDAVLRR